MNEIKFGSPYDFSYQRRSTPAGRRTADKMCVVCGDDGVRYLEKTGETNLYDYIQSFKDEVDLNKIIERCMISGDISMLQKVQGVYLDVTGFPVDSRSAHDLLNHTRLVYESLDQKVKAHYKGFEDFLEAFATQENLEKFIAISAPTSSDPVQEVTLNES